MTELTERAPISALLNNKKKLIAISEYHKANGDDHMSMTKVLEKLIDVEFKRLKLNVET